MQDEPLPTLSHDRYAIAKKLGEGGQAATFEAVDKRVGRLVVLKRFRVRGASSWKEVELAEREAKVLASLDHPNLPRYVEHFEENGELWLVTQKIEGESLDERRRRGGSSSHAEVIRFLADARAALDYLHARSPPVIHRDIKPSNVIRRPDGSSALIDFGSVRDRLKPEGGSTVVGTFGFMAPEQFQGRAMPASDVYGVGVTALVMLTGVDPEDLPHKGLAIDVAGALAGSRVPRGLVRALEQMLDPDPDRRAKRVPDVQLERGRASEREDDREAARLGDFESGPKGEAKPTRREARRERRRERHEARQLRREERLFTGARDPLSLFDAWQRARRRSGRRSFVPPVLLGFVLFGLTLAQIAVGFAVRAFVPALLVVLSIFFGRALREAARNVRAAGKRASKSLSVLRRAILHQEAEVRGARYGVRVGEVDVEAPRVRVAADATDHDAEIEAEAEREADAAARGVRR